jgi:hypothetical protein
MPEAIFSHHRPPKLEHLWRDRKTPASIGLVIGVDVIIRDIASPTVGIEV